MRTLLQHMMEGLQPEDPRRAQLQRWVDGLPAENAGGELDAATLDLVAGGVTPSALRDELFAYLSSNPSATDSTEGVSAWWLSRSSTLDSKR